MGRLSNPSEHLKRLVDRGVEKTKRGPKHCSEGSEGTFSAADRAASEEAGRLSNPTPRPVQRRLQASEVDLIAAEYPAGQSLRAIATPSASTTTPSPRTCSNSEYRAGSTCA